MMRSTVWERTRLVSWSVDRSVPSSVRPSTVRTSIFSGTTVSENVAYGEERLNCLRMN